MAYRLSAGSHPGVETSIIKRFAPSIVLLREILRGIAGAGRLSITLIGGFRYPVDSMDEKPQDVFNSPLMVEVMLRQKVGMSPNTQPHGQPFGQVEDILVRFIVTEKKQTDT